MNLERKALTPIIERAAGAEALIVHSAFAGLSRVGFSAESFCSVLIDGLRNTTLLMPTMSWRTVTPDQPIFDECTTASHTGVLTEIFRTGFSTYRSLHPTHSVAGHGALAQYLLASHHLGDTPCPRTSPYGLIRDFDGWILLLGVDLERCTAIHYAEETIAPDFYVRPVAEAEAYRLRRRDGTEILAKTRRHRRLPRDFSQFEPKLRDNLEFQVGWIGETPWRLFPLRLLYRIVLSALTLREDATLLSVTDSHSEPGKA